MRVANDPEALVMTIVNRKSSVAIGKTSRASPWL
jgi:hypothetical protein